MTNHDGQDTAQTLAPPFTAEPAVVGEHVRAWFIEPAGVVTYFPPESVFTDNDAQLLFDHFSPERMRATYGEDADFRFLHDWRGIVSYESKVRSIQIAWARSFPRERCKAFRICAPKNASPLLLMSISAGSVALELFGYRIELVDAFASAMAEFDVKVRGY